MKKAALYGSGILVLLFFTVVKCKAGEKPLRFFDFSAGYSYHYLRDEGMSPLIYSGSAGGLTFGFEKRSAKAIQCVSALFHYGSLKPLGTHPFVSSNMRGSIEFSYQRLMRKYVDDALSVYFGGAWQTFGVVRQHQRYVNNAVNYEWVMSLSPDVTLLYDFRIRKAAFTAKSRLTLPLISFYIRPAYASSLPEGFIAQEGSDFKAFWKSGKVATVNRMFRIIYLMELEYVLTNRNRLSIGYTWDYYSIGTFNRVKAATHRIEFGWMFNF